MSVTPAISGLVKAAESFHHALHIEAGQTHQSLSTLTAQLEKNCTRIEKVLNKHGIRAGNLPARSMYAAIWFLFLRQGSHLDQHLAFLTDMQARFAREYRLTHNPPLIQLYPSSYLYKVIPRSHTFTLILHEGFLTADEKTRILLINLAGKSRVTKKVTARIKAYTKTEPYQEVLHTLNRFAKAVYYEPDAAGKYYHLKESFERVNWGYFNGEQSLPHLQWSPRASYRKLGHFNPVPDTIQISSALDDRHIPEYALDYVMYHEMAHRVLGIAEVNGRKSSHNAAFHQLEGEYAYLEKAKQFFASKQFRQ